MQHTTEHLLRHITLLLSGVFLLIASFLILTEAQKKDFPEGGDNVAFILDVSQSMNVQDTEENSRLSTAKNIIYSLIQKNIGAQFSLSIFAGESQRILPFTSDIELFATFLNSLDSANITKQGTNINAALEDGIKSFGDEKTGTLILISDGDEDTIQLTSELQKDIETKQINLIVIGVGTQKGGYIPSGDIFSPYKIYQGKPVIAKLNENGLQKLSEQGGGKYYSYSQNIPLELGSNKQQENKTPILLFFSFLFWIFFLLLTGKKLYYK